MKKSLGLIMTCGMSLAKWSELGSLDREVRPYKELAGYFSRIVIFSYGRSEQHLFSSILPQNVRIVSKPRFVPSLIWSLLLPFACWTTFRGLDVIKTNQMSGSWTGVIAKKVHGTKLVVRCGYEWLSFAISENKFFVKRGVMFIIEKISYLFADKIILTSESDRDFVCQNFGSQYSKICVIPNYIDIELFKPNPKASISNRVIFVGRFSPQKNLGSLLNSLNNLDVEIVFIGSGPLFAEIKARAGLLNLRTHFVGNLPQTEVVSELTRSRVFILPSLYEGNPKSLLEAMSCGLACIGANSPGINNVIIDGESGLLCEINQDSIRDAVVKVLNDGELAGRLGQGARFQIERNNSLTACLDKEKNIYLDLLN